MSQRLIDKYERIIMNSKMVLCALGQPGSGKTEMMREVANRNELLFIHLETSMMDEGEFGGLPFKQENKQGIWTAYALQKWFNEAVESINIINPITNKNYKGALVFLDEFNRAKEGVKDACLQFLCNRQLGWEAKLPDYVRLASAGNLGEDDGCNVGEFDKAQRGRFAFVTHDLKWDEWVENFASKYINPILVDFLDKNSDHVFKEHEKSLAYACYRSWTRLDEYVKNITNKSNYSEEELLEFAVLDGENMVGPSVARLISYLNERIKNNSIISIKDILKDYSKVKPNVAKVSRDKISQMLSELMSLDLNTFNGTELKNVSDFLKDIDADERVGYLSELLKDEKYINAEGVMSPNWEKMKETFMNDYKKIARKLEQDEGGKEEEREKEKGSK